MDLQSQLPPPSFYLSTIKTGRLWLFTDVPILPEFYSSTLNRKPLPGQRVPYTSQGYGGGRTWNLQAKLNAWNAFLATDIAASGRPPGEIVYDDYLEIQKFVEDNAPSPMMLLHLHGRDAIQVIVESISTELALQEDTFHYDQQLPSTIPVELQLVEVVDYRVEFSDA